MKWSKYGISPVQYPNGSFALLRAFFTLLILCTAGLNASSALAGDNAKPSAQTTLPAWKANASLVAVRGIIWNERLSTEDTLRITLVVKNVSKRDVFALKKFNCHNYLFGTTGLHGDAEGAISDEDFIRLKPGEITTFSTFFLIDEAKEERFSVNFHNNMEREDVKPPTRDGIPVINHLEYNFGTIRVHDSNAVGKRTRTSRSPQEKTNQTPAAVGSRP